MDGRSGSRGGPGHRIRIGSQESVMCGRYRLSRCKQLIAEYFETDNEVDWEPRYNIAPSQPVGIIRQDPSRPERHFSPARWGLIPSWASDASIGFKTINARAETVASKPAFRDSFVSRRCLLPADGFFEWSRHEVACVIVRRARPDRTCHPIGSTLRGMAIRKRIV
jgi:putative SOS response-associated peptidase YedK